MVPGVLHDPERGLVRRVSVWWDGGDEGALRVVAEGGDSLEPVPAGDLVLSGGGWQGQAVHLAWQRGGRSWAVTVDQPAARAGLLTSLPPRFQADARRLAGNTARRRRRARLGALVLGALVALPAAGLVMAWVLRGRILDAVVARLPASLDSRLGDLAETQLRITGGFQAGGPATEAVRAIGERLLAAASPQPFRFRFYVRADPTVNAFAAPGGLVVVHTGLLAHVSGPDEVAGVLAHEVTHVLARHSLRQLLAEMGLVAAVTVLLGGDGLTGAAGGLARSLGLLSFSRDQERDADRGAVDLLVRARLPADGLRAFFERLARSGSGVPVFLNSHPASGDRAAALEAEIQQRGAWPVQPLALDWAAVQAAAQAGAPARP